MDFLEDLRLVDGPVLWIAWAAGAAGAGLPPLARRPAPQRDSPPDPAARWPDSLPSPSPPPSWLPPRLLVAAVHWLMIYVFSVFPEELPGEVLAWSLPPVTALLLWLMRLWWTLAAADGPAPGHAKPRRAARQAAAATAALLGVVLLSAVQINVYFGLNHTVERPDWAPPWRGSSRSKTG